MSKTHLVVTMLALTSITSLGCTTTAKRWWNNNLKLGPNYQTPSARHASSWLDANDDALIADIPIQEQWWGVFQDPVLSELVSAAYKQNLSVKAAFLRIEAAHLQRDIAVGSFFPQSQSVNASYSRQQANNNFFDSWSTGGSLSWELDLWGRLRRNIAAAEANVQANQADTNAIIVSLISEIATTYIQIRSFDERIQMAQRNVKIQQTSYGIAKKRNKILKTKIDERQALSNLEDTRALIPELERQRRNSINQLAVLLGTTPDKMLSWVTTSGSLPEVPRNLFVGVPCDLIRQRPDIKVAERTLAIQAEQIGIAEADLYPQLSVSGSISVQANSVSDLFTPESTIGSIGPSFQWNILNYGRIANNVLLQDNLFQQALVQYQETALLAQQEVENGIIDFLKFNEQLQHQQISAEASAETVELGQKRYKAGKESFSSVFVYESDLVIKTDAVIQTKANIALALIRTYTAFGGGWQIRVTEALGSEIYVPSPQGSYVSAGDESDAATIESANTSADDQPPTDEASERKNDFTADETSAAEDEVSRPALERAND